MNDHNFFGGLYNSDASVFFGGWFESGLTVFEIEIPSAFGVQTLISKNIPSSFNIKRVFEKEVLKAMLKKK